MSGPGRATSYAELRERMELLFPDDHRWREFRPAPTDVIISPFAKCGTTWLQQIVHGLRSHGDMDFDDISYVVPWIEVSPLLGIDLDADQRARPRAFKSHLGWHDVPKGGRYIVSVRDPLDAFHSLYRFFEGWLFEPGSISVEEFAEGRLGGGASDYWAHLGSWLEQRSRPDVLLLAFEHMRADLPNAVRRVAGFIGVDDPAAIDIATHQATYEFMSGHRGPFIDHGIRRRSEQVAGIPPGGDAAKVRAGRTGTGRGWLPEAVVRRLDERWDLEITARFGYTDYADLLDDFDGG